MTAGVWCGRCCEPIERDEEYTTFVIDGATGAGGVVYRHARPCVRSPQQAYPEPEPYHRRWNRRRS